MTGLPRELTAVALATAQAIIRLMSVLVGLLGQHNAAALASGILLLLIVGFIVRYTAVVLAVALAITLLASSPIWRAEARVTQAPCPVAASPQPQPQRRGAGCVVSGTVSHHVQNAARRPAARPS
jgi:hypothetical protein